MKEEEFNLARKIKKKVVIWINQHNSRKKYSRCAYRSFKILQLHYIALYMKKGI